MKLKKIDDWFAGQYEHDWWYYFKKKFAIYPGIRNFVAADFLQDHYEARKAGQSLFDRIVNGAVFTGFHLWLPFRAAAIARKYGLGQDWARKALDIGRKRFADPNDIALFRIREPAELNSYLRRFEHASINKIFNPKNWQADCALGNKIAFHNICADHGLPHPPIFAAAMDGKAKIYDIPGAGQFALKPAGGEGGRGFMLLDFDPADSDDPETALQKLIQNQIKNQKGCWIAQPKLKTHPTLLPLAQSALITARLTTMLNETGQPEIVTSVLRFPASPDSVVDNIKSGGLMAFIDLETGTLDRACVGRGLGEVTRHPVSDVVIEDIEIPDFAAAKRLVTRAHDVAFSAYNLVGWDVALAEDGPILLEGNGKPCMIVAQRAPRRGIGDTRFGELVRHHLRA